MNIYGIIAKIEYWWSENKQDILIKIDEILHPIRHRRMLREIEEEMEYLYQDDNDYFPDEMFP